AHLIAADLLRHGVDPETVFQHLYATAPRRRLELLREALGTLETDPDLGLAWMVVPADVDQRLHTTSEDYEGLIDHARTVEGTEVALLFRQIPGPRTKISFRSNGDTDVNRIARLFGGGGHVKASGATVEGPVESVVPRVMKAVRETLTS
ncbi:MAG TPA: DHHA1 domain-containing protein, partial [Longimicrobiaceae bacterium]|nr:DHHA1 domain-containing protein [Longimicrobiaceae bacterium]